MRNEVAKNLSENFLWNSGEIAKLMSRKHVPNRWILAQRLGKPINTICRTFNEQWEGEAKPHVAVAICRTFNVHISKLLHDPRYR